MNQSYCIDNTPLSKEQYDEAKNIFFRDKEKFLAQYKECLLLPGQNI